MKLITPQLTETKEDFISRCLVSSKFTTIFKTIPERRLAGELIFKTLILK